MAKSVLQAEGIKDSEPFNNIGSTTFAGPWAKSLKLLVIRISKAHESTQHKK
jgi:hypothetical protein